MSDDGSVIGDPRTCSCYEILGVMRYMRDMRCVIRAAPHAMCHAI
jgi:hypothetical protein